MWKSGAMPVIGKPTLIPSVPMRYGASENVLEQMGGPLALLSASSPSSSRTPNALGF